LINSCKLYLAALHVVRAPATLAWSLWADGRLQWLSMLAWSGLGCSAFGADAGTYILQFLRIKKHSPCAWLKERKNRLYMHAYLLVAQLQGHIRTITFLLLDGYIFDHAWTIQLRKCRCGKHKVLQLIACQLTAATDHQQKKFACMIVYFYCDFAGWGVW